MVTTDADVELMAEACRRPPEPVGDYRIGDCLTNLMATVIDFQLQTVTVERALAHFGTVVRPSLKGLGDLVDLLDRWPADQAGNTVAARYLWGYDLWTRAQMLRDLASYFTSTGVTGQDALKRWAAGATFEQDFKGRVPGLGAAVFQWLVMRQGVDTVKPDIHVHRFAARVPGRPLSDADVVTVIEAAARRIGRSAHRIDWAIWEAGRVGTSDESDAAPNRRYVRDPTNADRSTPPPARMAPATGSASARRRNSICWGRAARLSSGLGIWHTIKAGC